MPARDRKNPALWGGRFADNTDAAVQAFTASVAFDQRLYAHDIDGSLAHARMLAGIGVLTAEELAAIEQGLEAIRAEIEAEEFPWDDALEDVHMNIEARLTARIGEAGKKLHTGRSRNDQVATDLRLYCRDAIDAICAELVRLASGVLTLAEQEATTIMPGFTHLQTAQPVTFGHHLLAWLEMLERDHERLGDCRRRVNVMPLGAAALAGTTFPIDRERTARDLGFERPARNSLDAVSDRDFAIELAAAASITMMHLSRIAEELILWTSAQFRFVDLPDRFCTGSSIMPQKRNPDVPELVRGKGARVTGHLMALLTLMKGQPLAYNRDNQEDKEALFDTIDTLAASLAAFADMLPALQARPGEMAQAARAGFATATDLADYLVVKGIPFREAHAIVGQAVRIAEGEGVDLAELTLEQLRSCSERIEEDVFSVLTLEGSVAARNHFGGTAPAQVRLQVESARQRWGVADMAP